MAKIVPGYIDQVNTVIRWAENPCDAPWLLYLELALPAAGEVAITLLSFDALDVIRSWARPKGLRTGRHGRRGRKSGRRRFAFPEPSELVADRLPGAELAKARKVSQGVKSLWLIDGAIQRGLWYWCVADLTLGFFADWLGAVEESQVCRTQRVGAAAFEDTNVQIALTGWSPISGVSRLYQKGGIGLEGSPALWLGGFHWGEGRAGISLAIERQPQPDEPPEVNFEARLNFGDFVENLGQGTDEPGPPGKKAMIMPARKFGPHTNVLIEVRIINGGAATLHSMGAAVQTIGDL